MGVVRARALEVGKGSLHFMLMARFGVAANVIQSQDGLYFIISNPIFLSQR